MLEKIPLTLEQSLELFLVQNKLHETGQFSGTYICEFCGGDVKYNGAKSDGAKLGGCKDCGVPYIDRKNIILTKFYNS